MSNDNPPTITRKFLNIIPALFMGMLLQGCGGANLNDSEAFIRYNKFLDSLAAASAPYHADDSLVMDNINGIRQDNFDFFDAEGYNIDLEFMYEPLTENMIQEIKEKYSITPSKFIADTIRNNYIRFSHEEQEDSVKISTVYYVIGMPSKIAVISYRTMLGRNEKFEFKFNELAITDSIPESCFSNMVIDSIKFAGRHIMLGSACVWQGVNNIQCPHLGQMNWSEFQEASRAVEMIKSQINISLAKDGMKIDTVQVVDVVFEGHETKALKLVYHISLPKILLGGSNTIIAYYVVSPVRNRYVACVLSHYDDDVAAGELPPLLAEVMSLSPN